MPEVNAPLEAACANCASWQKTLNDGHATAADQGFCGKGLYPDAGSLLCQKYEATGRFKQEIISRMLKDHGPMAMPVKLIGGRMSAKKLQGKKRKN